MSFDTTEKIIAIAPAEIPTLLGAMLAQYGEDLTDGARTVRTIGAHWDDSEHTRLRAADFPTTINGQPLTDGRMAFRCLWQAAAAAAVERGDIPGVAILTPAELTALTPPPPEPPAAP